MSDVFEKAFDQAAPPVSGAAAATGGDPFEAAFDSASHGANLPASSAFPGGHLHPALVGVAQRLQIDPDHLARIIRYESGGRPDNVNPQSGASGLIQFLPSTAKGLGIPIERLRTMSVEQQAPYVEKYLRENGAVGKGFTDLYASVLYPSAVGKSFDAPLFAKGTPAYAQNAQLDVDHDGVVTKAEAARSAYGGPVPEELDYQGRMGMRQGEIHMAQDLKTQQITDLHARARVLEMEIGRKEGLGQAATEGRKQLSVIFSQLRALQGVPEPKAPTFSDHEDFASDPAVAAQQALQAARTARTPEARRGALQVAQGVSGDMQRQDAAASDLFQKTVVKPVLDLPHNARIGYQKAAVKLFTGHEPTEDEINSHPAMRVYNHVMDAGDYFLPYFGQVKGGIEASQTAADVASSGNVAGSLKQVWHGSLDPTAPGLEPEERGIRAAFLALMVVHPLSEGKIALDNKLVAGRLVQEYGMDPVKAAETVRMARDAVNGGYGRSVSDRIAAFRDQMSQAEIGKVSGAMARGSADPFESAFDHPSAAAHETVTQPPVGDFVINPHSDLADLSVRRRPPDPPDISTVAPTRTGLPQEEPGLVLGRTSDQVQRENYLRPLSDYAPVLYHETSPELAHGFGRDISGKYFSTTPELALGQAGRGVVMEYPSEGIHGQINTSKPSWKQVYDRGHAEMIAGPISHGSPVAYRFQPGMEERFSPLVNHPLVEGWLTQAVRKGAWAREELPEGVTRYYDTERSGPVSDVGASPKTPRIATETANPAYSGVSAEGIPFHEERMAPQDIGVYPGLQYKRAGIVDAENAVTGELKGVSKYDQATAGPLTVWETADGKRWVMNGHHRRELAIRTGESDVPVKVYKETDGVTFEDARTYGALQNIKDGKGTALDAATVLQDGRFTVDELKNFGVNTRSGVGQNATALLKLSPDALELVRDGTVPEAVGAGIGDAGLPPERQMATIREAARAGLESRRSAEILSDRARNVPLVDKSGGTGDLFGDVPMDLALGEQAKISELAHKKLVSDRRLLDAMVRGKAVGDTSVDVNAQSHEATIQDVATQVMATDPEVSRILEQEAKSYAERPVRNQLDQAVRRVVDAARVAAKSRLESLSGATASTAPSGVRDGGGAELARESVAQPGEAQLRDVLTPDQSALLHAPAEDLELNAPDNAAKRPQVDRPSQGGLDIGTEDTGQAGLNMNRAPGAVRENRTPGQEPLPETEPEQTSTQSTPQTPRAPQQRAAAKGALAAVKQIFGEKLVLGKEEAMLLAREHGAELARRSAMAARALSQAAESFDARTPEAKLDFIDRMETGQPQVTPEDQQLSTAFRKMMDGRRDEVQALGEGKLEQWIENYFPHFWEDPNQANSWLTRIFGKRPLEGSKSFLKKRSIPTIREGMDAGLVPITDNPAELVLMKVREMDRYILGTRLAQDLHARGILKFSSIFTSAADMAADGRAIIEDNAFKVFGPHSVEVPESFDASVREGLMRFTDSLGINVKKALSLGREAGRQYSGALGLSDGKGTVMQRHFTDDGVLSHEIGHELDARYGLGDWLLHQGGSAYDMETAALAEYRHDGSAPDSFRDYIQLPEERLANLIHAVIHAPALAERVAPTSTMLLRKFLGSHAELRPLLDIQHGVRLDTNKVSVPVQGLQIMGHYTAPIDVAKVLNHYLSPGLSSWAGDTSNGLKSAVGYGFKAGLAVNNVLNRAQLGMSWFHGFTTMANAMASDTALGIRKLSGIRRGRTGALRSGVGDFVMGHIPVASMVRDFVRGGEIKRAYLDGPGTEEMSQILEGVLLGGGRIQSQTFFESGAALSFWRAMKAGAYGTGARLAVPAVIDAVSLPIMEHLVPRVKLSAFAKIFSHEMDLLGPDADPDMIRRKAAEAWDSVDNRFGQMVYDNVFWHRAAKDITMASTRSVGWNLGTIRELGGGMYDFGGDLLNGRFKQTGISNRAAFVIGMTSSTAVLGALMSHAMTGEWPQSLLDYFFPRTGRKNADGTDERVSLPGYLKDMAAYAHDPGGTAMHKLGPGISIVQEMLANKDFYGEQIRNPDDPLVQQGLEAAEHVGKSFIPFTAQSEMRHIDQTGHPDVLSLVGVSPAAAWVSRTPAMQLALEYASRDRSMRPRTHDEVQGSDARKQVLKMYQNGEKAEAIKKLDAMPLSEQQRANVYRDISRIDAGEDPIVGIAERLQAKELLNVFDRGSSAERRILAPRLLDRLQRDAGSGRMGSYTQAQVDRIIQQTPELKALEAG